MLGRGPIAAMALAATLAAGPGAAQIATGGVPVHAKQSRHCSALAPADWSVTSQVGDSREKLELGRSDDG